MKQLKKLLTVTIVIFAVICFLMFMIFLWASSPNHSSSEYSLLKQKDHYKNSEQDSVYKILTYNIGFLSGMTNNRPIMGEKSFYQENLHTVLKKFKTLDSDIICLQEIDFDSDRSHNMNQQDSIQALGYEYAWQAVNWDEKHLPFPGDPLDINNHYGSIYSGQSIISKFPLAGMERIELERPTNITFHKNAFYLDRLIQKAQVKINDQTIYLLNIHLEAYDKTTRIKQIQYVSDLIKNLIQTTPLLLVGDFNSDINKSSSLQTILNLPGMMLANTGKINASQTFPSNKPKRRLDYIFYNAKFIEMEEARVLHDFGTISDHLPVLMSFRLKETR